MPKPLTLLVVVLLIVPLVPVPLTGQSPNTESLTTPRTSWGDPDLSGIWTANEMHSVPLERTDSTTGSETLSGEAAAVRREQTTNRTVNAEGIGNYDRAFRDTALGYTKQSPSIQASLIVDPPNGQLPPLTPEEERRLEVEGPPQRTVRPASWEEMGVWPRCITRGALTIVQPSGYNNGVQIIQGPGYVAITKEMLHETRVIPVQGTSHVGTALTTWSGDAKGHWEGDTLVVDVTNFNGKSQLFGASESAHLVERFTRIGPNQIEYLFTVDDPKVWTKPWTGRMTITKDESQYELVEYACHEGNYSMVNSLSGARAVEKAGTASR